MWNVLIFVLTAVALAAWLGATMCMLRMRPRLRMWMKPLVARGEVPSGGGGISFEAWRRLYGRRPEMTQEAERLRLETRTWSTRVFILVGFFVVALSLAVLVKLGAKPR